MNIDNMLTAVNAANAKGEVPTIAQIMALSEALHEMTVKMPEFLWFDKSFEDMGDTAYLAGQAAKRDEDEYSQDLPGFAGTWGQLDALTAVAA